MICPICGFDMQDEKTCEKCGWVAESAEQSVEQPAEEVSAQETETVSEAVEEIDVDLKEVEIDSEVEEEEYEFASTEDDLVVDFDEIDNNVVAKPSTSGGWMTPIVSFLAGVLATLIVIGCFNGTIVKQFDKLTNGTPYDVVESFCGFYLRTDLDADKMVETFSPYLRAQIIGELEYYNQMYGSSSDVDLDIDVTNDKEFSEIAKYYIDLVSESNIQKVKIKNLEFTDIEYYKSDSDEFKGYLSEYKSGSDELANADNISVFANVIFDLSYEVTTSEQQTTQAQTTKKKSEKDKDKKETTAAQTTQAPTTKKETSDVQCSAICVKINDSWYVFNGMQVLN